MNRNLNYRQAFRADIARYRDDDLAQSIHETRCKISSRWHEIIMEFFYHPANEVSINSVSQQMMWLAKNTLDLSLLEDELASRVTQYVERAT